MPLNSDSHLHTSPDHFAACWALLLASCPNCHSNQSSLTCLWWRYISRLVLLAGDKQSALRLLSHGEASDFKRDFDAQFLTSSLWQRKDTNTTNVSSSTGGKLEVVCRLVWPTDIGGANNGGCDWDSFEGGTMRAAKDLNIVSLFWRWKLLVLEFSECNPQVRHTLLLIAFVALFCVYSVFLMYLLLSAA